DAKRLSALGGRLPADAAVDLCRRLRGDWPRPACRAAAGSHGRERGVGLRGPELHGRGGIRRRQRYPAGGGQTPRRQEGLRTFAAPLRRGAFLRVGIPVPAAGQGLRATATDGSGAALRRLRLPLSPPSDHRARAEAI
ncbi:Mobile element protein, partial [uncultured Rubrobacteraceae bacterium]